MNIISTPTNPFQSGYSHAQTFKNRTGGATVVGGVYVLDTNQAESESDTIGKGLGSIVAVATAKMCSPVVIATEVVADNGDVKCVLADGGGVVCEVLVDSTTDIAKGDPLKQVNASDSLVKATVGTDHYNAIALEARTANDEGLITALFFSLRQF